LCFVFCIIQIFFAVIKNVFINPKKKINLKKKKKQKK
jgi:hypothetical protein